MTIINFPQKTTLTSDGFPPHLTAADELLVLCRTHEIRGLRDVYGFDEGTVLDCADLDESVRYACFDGYDFISLVHVELSESTCLLQEINLYVSPRYLVLVMPEHDSPRLRRMEENLLAHAKTALGKPGHISGIYYHILHSILADFSDTLESLEDYMQALSDEIVANADKTHFARITHLRNMAYTAKKQLRALSYLGEQMLLDENRLIAKSQLNYFRNINTRLKKLYDFADSLYNLGGEMLYSYDSRLTMKTNDTVNKLTAATLFFGPLTVIAGIYGMNFHDMPELSQPWGYPASLLLMLGVSIALFIFMKRKKWL